LKNQIFCSKINDFSINLSLSLSHSRTVQNSNCGVKETLYIVYIIYTSSIHHLYIIYTSIFFSLCVCLFGDGYGWLFKNSQRRERERGLIQYVRIPTNVCVRKSRIFQLISLSLSLTQPDGSKFKLWGGRERNPIHRIHHLYIIYTSSIHHLYINFFLCVCVMGTVVFKNSQKRRERERANTIRTYYDECLCFIFVVYIKKVSLSHSLSLSIYLSISTYLVLHKYMYDVRIW
jgi:hypothetical protein